MSTRGASGWVFAIPTGRPDCTRSVSSSSRSSKSGEDALEVLPGARRFSRAAIDDEILGSLGDLRHRGCSGSCGRRLLAATPCSQRRASRRADAARSPARLCAHNSAPSSRPTSPDAASITVPDATNSVAFGDVGIVRAVSIVGGDVLAQPCVQRPRGRRRSRSGRRNSSACAPQRAARCARISRDFLATSFVFRAAVTPMLTWSSWFAEVGMLSTLAGCE